MIRGIRGCIVERAVVVVVEVDESGLEEKEGKEEGKGEFEE